jgi:hypothetical protein
MQYSRNYALCTYLILTEVSSDDNMNSNLCNIILLKTLLPLILKNVIELSIKKQ